MAGWGPDFRGSENPVLFSLIVMVTNGSTQSQGD